MKAELDDLKATSAARAADAQKGKNATALEEESRRLEKETKASKDSLAQDQEALKSISGELEMLRELIKRTITVSGEEIIKGMDGRAGGRSGSLARESSASAVKETAPISRGSSARFGNLK